MSFFGVFFETGCELAISQCVDISVSQRATSCSPLHWPVYKTIEHINSEDFELPINHSLACSHASFDDIHCLCLIPWHINRLFAHECSDVHGDCEVNDEVLMTFLKEWHFFDPVSMDIEGD